MTSTPWHNIPITPVPKPRMTQCDRWKSRPCTQRYWNYKDALRLWYRENSMVDVTIEIVFLLPMPKSWSKAKRAKHLHQRHQSKPDLDNLVKGYWDAILDDDALVWCGSAAKIWGEQGAILWRPMAPVAVKNAIASIR